MATNRKQVSPEVQARRLLSTLSRDGAARYARNRESHNFGVGNDERAEFWQRVGVELQRIADRGQQ